MPIPIFYCADCNEPIINDATISRIQDLFREHGSDIWFAKDAAELIPEGLTCPKCGGTHFRKETDIMDVWFDSGSSHKGVLKIRPELRTPADFYLEGSDPASRLVPLLFADIGSLGRCGALQSGADPWLFGR